MRYLGSILALLLLLPSAARADWFEASSAHFVVYADDSEEDIRRFSEQLERYHAAMEIVTWLDMERPSPSNRVTVFVVRNVRQVQRLAGDDNGNIGGFYIPRAGGSVAFVPRVRLSRGQPDQSMITLLHEYAHHFLISNSDVPQPRWVSEGGAEFFASAEFTREGGVSIGRPAQHRAAELFLARDVKAEELLDPDLYEQKRRRGYDAFYGKSWLLYHYLIFSEHRSGQLRQYLRQMMDGQRSRDAAAAVFGSFDELEDELEDYLDQPTMLSLVFQPSQFEIGPSAVRPLRAGEEEIMPVRIRSRRGVTREQALELLGDARAIAAHYPDDAAVLAALAEAEFDAGNDAEAIAAADAALALDPGQVNAYVQKGYALFRRAAEAEDREAAYKEAIAPFLALNKREPDHPLALIYFYRSFLERGRPPTENAILALERAAELAPFDLGLRLNVASQQIREGRLDQARLNLVPVAYSPHANPMAEGARAVIDRIDAGATGEPQALLQLLSGRASSGAGAD